MTTETDISEFAAQIDAQKETPEVGYSGYFQEAAEEHHEGEPTSMGNVRSAIALIAAIGVGISILGIALILISNA